MRAWSRKFSSRPAIFRHHWLFRLIGPWATLAAACLTLTAIGCQGTDLPDETDGDGDQEQTDFEFEADSVAPDGDDETVLEREESVEIDGDGVADGDADQLPFECEGPCQGTEPAGCRRMDLCLCVDGMWRQRPCQEICEEQGALEATSCRWDATEARYRCFCDEPAISCAADYVIRSLPFVHEDNTHGAGNHLDLSPSCFDWPVPGADHVFEIALDAGNYIFVLLDLVSPTYDPALAVADACSNQAVCLAGRDANGAGSGENLEFIAAADGRYFIAVESGHSYGSSSSSGGYRLAVDGQMAAPDGDAEGSEYDLDAETEIDGDADADGETEGETPPDGDENSETEAEIDGDDDGEPASEDDSEDDRPSPEEDPEIPAETEADEPDLEN